VRIPNVTGLVKVGKTFIMANRPEILFGASITATLAAVGLAAKGGYEARGIVEDERMKRVASPEPPFDTFLDYYQEFKEKAPEIPVKEKIQLTWLCYMPAAITTITAVGSTTGLHIVHVKDKKMMAQAGLAALEEVKNSAKQYEKDVKEAIEENAGVKTEEKIKNAIEEKQESRINRDPLYSVRDARTGRTFLSTESRIQASINEVNHLLNNHKDVSVNDFYVWAGMPEVEGGDEIGWSGTFVSLTWGDDHDEDGTPVREYSFSPRPKEGFDDARAPGSRPGA
jgi:hypothetical protein